MRKLALLIAMIFLGIPCAGGVALAVSTQCKAQTDERSDERCIGTDKGDRIIGSESDDDIRSMQGEDFVAGLGGDDFIRGGIGADRLKGNFGDDYIQSYAHADSPGGIYSKFSDRSDDLIYGGQGDDEIEGGYGEGGVDRVFGGSGDDTITVAQGMLEARGFQTAVTHEIVDCGPGKDTVYYDARREETDDEVDAESCEVRRPVDSNGNVFPIPGEQD